MRRAAVLGSPIAHSRSPQLHLAAYRALGLADWSYDRILCTAAELPAVVGGFGPEWVGVSVTMPGKVAALHFADATTDRADLVGAANTLLRTETGWLADNTDVDGVVGALGTAVGRGARAVVVGSGGTAPAAVVGLAHLGVTDLVVTARSADRAAPIIDLGRRCGLRTEYVELGHSPGAVDAVVSTVPPDAAAQYIDTLAATPLLLDAIYDPWPTPLALAVEAAGGRVIGGLQMLLNQAYAQVELFTGQPAPKEVMIAALT